MRLCSLSQWRLRAGRASPPMGGCWRSLTWLFRRSFGVWGEAFGETVARRRKSYNNNLFPGSFRVAVQCYIDRDLGDEGKLQRLVMALMLPCSIILWISLTYAFAKYTSAMFGVSSPHGTLSARPLLHEAEGGSSRVGCNRVWMEGGHAIGYSDGNNESR